MNIHENEIWIYLKMCLLDTMQGWYTWNAFSSYVDRGEIVPVDKEVAHNFHPLYRNQTEVNFDIYGTLSKTARFTTEPTMQQVRLSF